MPEQIITPKMKNFDMAMLNIIAKDNPNLMESSRSFAIVMAGLEDNVWPPLLRAYVINWAFEVGASSSSVGSADENLKKVMTLNSRQRQKSASLYAQEILGLPYQSLHTYDTQMSSLERKFTQRGIDFILQNYKELLNQYSQ